MDYLFMVPFAGATAFDRMARAAADMAQIGWRVVEYPAQLSSRDPVLNVYAEPSGLKQSSRKRTVSKVFISETPVHYKE